MCVRIAQSVGIVAYAVGLVVSEGTAQPFDQQVRVTEVDLLPRFELFMVNPDGSLGRNLTHTLPDGGSEPSYSRDCTNIVFRSGPDIYVMEADGSHKRRLTACRCLAEDCELEVIGRVQNCRFRSPVFSPDGSRVLFNGQSRIWVIGSDGSGLRPLIPELQHTEYRGDPWSPDGSSFLFRSGEHLYVADPVGNNLRRLTTKRDVSDCSYRDHCNNLSRARSWSPDGSEILFQSSGDNNVRVMRADGSESRPIDGVWGWPITWSPDGTQLVIETMTSANDVAINVVGVDGSGWRTLVNIQTEDPGRTLRWTRGGIEFWPGRFSNRWSVNGVELFTDFSADGSGVFVIDPDGTNVRRTGSLRADAVCPPY